MKKLIYLTGQIDHPFLCNEIGVFCDTFDEVIVIAYNDNKEKCDMISKKFGFKYILVSDEKAGIKELIKWRRESFVKEEMARHKGISLRVIKRRAYIYLYGIYGIKIIKIIRKNISVKPGDEMYVYSFWLSRPGYGAALLSYYEKGKILRTVARTHRYDLYEEENEMGFLPFRQFISENLNTIYFSSKDTIEYYKNKHYSDKHIPIAKLSYLGTRETNRKKIDKKGQLVIASCSLITKRKRLDLIVKFVKSLSTIMSVKWIHIGDGELEEQIKALAKELLNGVDYQFVGRITDDEIYDLYNYQDVDFFINLSDSEGIPVSIMEAMSMGIPVIARNVGGISDAITDNVNGIIVQDIDRLQDVAARVADLFTDTKQYSAMSEKTYKKWDITFNGKRNVEFVAKDIIDSSLLKEITL